MPDRSFRSYLEESLARVAADSPSIHARLCCVLGGRALGVEVGRERVALRVEGGRVTVGPMSAPCPVVASTSRAEIVALADGARSLEDAVLEDRVRLHGSAEDLATCFDALIVYLGGVVRSPELSSLMDAFRRDTDG